MLTDLKTTNLTLDPSSENQKMKIKKLLLTFTVAAMGLQQASAQTSEHFSGRAAVRNLADAGDDSGNRYASNSPVGPVSFENSLLAPTASSCCGDSVWGDCYGGCGNSSFGSCGQRTRRNGWFSAETLLYFGANRNSPVLAMVAGDRVNPLEGESAFGGTLTSGLVPGYRVSAGFYIDPQQRLGVGARVFGTFDSTTNYSVASEDGTTSIGVPFFNPNLFPNPGQDAFVVSGNLPGGDPIATGSLQAGEAFSMVGAEASGYVLLSRGGSHRFDLVAGYTYNQLTNTIRQSFDSTNLLDGDGIPDGTVFEYQDRFSTYNRFNGAHLGVLSSVVRNRVSLSTLAKVSFGDMRNSTTIAGSSTITDPIDPPVNGDGFFARASNIGTISNNRFAFLPELGIKMGYCFRPNMELSVGYTLLMWSSVALAGEQIDSVVDLTGNSNRPSPSNHTSAYWMQSIDLGLNWSF